MNLVENWREHGAGTRSSARYFGFTVFRHWRLGLNFWDLLGSLRVQRRGIFRTTVSHSSSPLHVFVG